MEKIKILELFGGIGACSKALDNLGIDYEIADYVEIDKYAVKSFNAIHNTNFEPQDICEWNKDIEVDLIMHGSPCQDFSLAGKQAGGDEGSGTRSSLMYETIRIVEKLKPKYVIWENVKNLLSKKHRHNFEAYLETMEQLGYTNYYQVLNAKDYGVPQNRERVFTISILGNENYEFPKGEECDSSIKVVGNYMPSGHDASRIVDENGLAPTVKENHGTVTAVLQRFEFPPKKELKLKLKDMLEDEVDEKYYLSEKMIKYINANNEKWTGNNDKSLINKSVASAINTGEGSRRCDASNYVSADVGENFNLKRPEKVIKHLIETNQIKELPCCCDSTINNPRVRDISNCITSRYNAGIQNQKQIGLCVVEPSIKIKNATKKGYQEATVGNSINLKSKCKRLNSLVEKTEFEEGKVLNLDLYNQTTNENISQCLTEPHHNSQRLFDGLRIRKLTPKECFRLMGFDDKDYEKASKVNSNTQLYKQAGNSIVVNVLEAILKNLLGGD